MKKEIIGATVLAAVSAVVVVAVRRFGPDLAQRGMQKCHEMMEHLAEQDTSELSGQLKRNCGDGPERGSYGQKLQNRAAG